MVKYLNPATFFSLVLGQKPNDQWLSFVDFFRNKFSGCHAQENLMVLTNIFITLKNP